ncbi:MAG TPA: hypothetical protein VFE41_21255 [Acetobacteraceae bacterium]|jgi:isocitrate/isopropylmalate dehydrogenase|nr:hypothetical protein [Acetobacteraceae bacterium]
MSRIFCTIDIIPPAQNAWREYRCLVSGAALMLDHVGLTDQAARLRGAMDGALNQDKVRTRDLGGAAGTREFAAAVTKRIGQAEGAG